MHVYAAIYTENVIERCIGASPWLPQALLLSVSEAKVCMARSIRAKQWEVVSSIVAMAHKRALARIQEMQQFGMKVAVRACVDACARARTMPHRSMCTAGLK